MSESHNSVSGPVQGHLIQAGKIDNLSLHIEGGSNLRITETGETASEIVERLRRQGKRGHADDVRMDVGRLLLSGGLEISERDLQLAETTSGSQPLIVVAKGDLLILTSVDLRDPSVVEEAEKHLGGEIRSLVNRTGRRYVGILTDGKEWRLYYGASAVAPCVASLLVDGAGVTASELLAWLEAVLGTRGLVKPTPRELEQKLGAGSPSYQLDSAELMALYAECRDQPRVAVKRELWAMLLRTASGTGFVDSDTLFVDHTLLVTMAKVIGHAVMGFQPQDPQVSAESIVAGERFIRAGISGVIESDFFDWVVEVPAGQRFVKGLARRMTRFDWSLVEHDVMKVLYESIISEEVRHRLGEYYTPDWLAEYIVAECVDDPLEQRVLDASCGSGTFLFHAVRAYAQAAAKAGVEDGQIVDEVRNHVQGFDVHPVAVTLARVTYLLALGMHRLQDSSRPKFGVPVYLGDSLRWGKERTLLSSEQLVIPTVLDHDVWVSDPQQQPDFADLPAHLQFPPHIVSNEAVFNELVNEMAKRAIERRCRGRSSIDGLFRRLRIPKDDWPVLQRTFERMCDLHDEERDHIWGYYVRNEGRVVWAARPDNRVDVLVGNPPWLAYRYMTVQQRESFAQMSRERDLWVGGRYATNQDLSALFVARCVERYLRVGGRFGFVMPEAALSRGQYAGFRTGIYGTRTEPVKVAFARPWDLRQVKPKFFGQSVSVVFGSRIKATATAAPLNEPEVEVWSGRFETGRATRDEAKRYLTRESAEEKPFLPPGSSSYRTRFRQGATLVPRFLHFVTLDAPGPLGISKGVRLVRSWRSPREQKKWKDLPSLEGVVENDFIRSVHRGDTILPFRDLAPSIAIIPWYRGRLLAGDDDIELFPGLADWWYKAEDAWRLRRQANSLDLRARIDFGHGLSSQFPISPYRVVFNKSGAYLAAAVLVDPTVIVDHKLIWGTVSSLTEGQYLTAILNSNVFRTLARHYQAHGENSPRDFDKAVFRLPVPEYEETDPAHQRLVELARRAEQVAADVELPQQSFESLRRRVRSALTRDGVAAELDGVVEALLLDAGVVFRRANQGAS